jgi:hypothetical protein
VAATGPHGDARDQTAATDLQGSENRCLRSQGLLLISSHGWGRRYISANSDVVVLIPKRPDLPKRRDFGALGRIRAAHWMVCMTLRLG